MTLLYTCEQEARAAGYRRICGVDEAGRGPLAGPVCAAAVMLPPGVEIDGVNDSKKLSEKARERLYDEIRAKAQVGVAFASEREIDERNILGATFLAMRRAVEALPVPPDLLLVDGNRDPRIGPDTRCMVGGDAVCASIAAASILAKVTRDRLMRAFDRQYPQYGFAQHKGYPTRAHYEAVARYGLCPIHRRSFFVKRPELLRAPVRV